MDDPSLTRAAAEIMGWRAEKDYVESDGSLLRRNGHFLHPWRPLASMDDAMMIVGKLQKELWGMTLSQIEIDPNGRERFRLDKWLCRFSGFDNEVESVASTPQRAIVLAALKVGK